MVGTIQTTHTPSTSRRPIDRCCVGSAPDWRHHTVSSGADAIRTVAARGSVSAATAGGDRRSESARRTQRTERSCEDDEGTSTATKKGRPAFRSGPSNPEAPDDDVADGEDGPSRVSRTGKLVDYSGKKDICFPVRENYGTSAIDALKVLPNGKTIGAQDDTIHVESVDEIGRAIRNARKDQGLTQREFAAIAGVGVRFLSEVERGKTTAEVGLLLRVLSTAGYDVALSPRRWSSTEDSAFRSPGEAEDEQ